MVAQFFDKAIIRKRMGVKRLIYPIESMLVPRRNRGSETESSVKSRSRAKSGARDSWEGYVNDSFPELDGLAPPYLVTRAPQVYLEIAFGELLLGVKRR